jgi:hypothetical protein
MATFKFDTDTLTPPDAALAAFKEKIVAEGVIQQPILLPSPMVI